MFTLLKFGRYLVINQSIGQMIIFDLMTALEEMLRGHKMYYNLSWGKHECVDQISGQSIQWS